MDSENLTDVDKDDAECFKVKNSVTFKKVPNEFSGDFAAIRIQKWQKNVNRQNYWFWKINNRKSSKYEKYN